MYQYRVTKYDPSLRAPSGAYPIDDWTSRSDIGKSFCGVCLTETDYLRVEQAYLKVAAAFLREAGIAELTVVSLENHGQCSTAPRDGSRIKADEIPGVLRSLLREEFWCKLESATAFIHIGYDYYMYVGTPVESSEGSAVARSNGLYVEQFNSPYAQSAI